MTIPNESMINETVVHFSKYRKLPISSNEAMKTIVNFNGFIHLLLRLDKKRSIMNTGRELKNVG